MVATTAIEAAGDGAEDAPGVGAAAVAGAVVGPAAVAGAVVGAACVAGANVGAAGDGVEDELPHATAIVAITVSAAIPDNRFKA